MSHKTPLWPCITPAALALLAFSLVPSLASAQDSPSTSAGCRVESGDYKGWAAQQLTNGWLRLIVVPQNGGRLMQVTFAGHDYLFVNPQYAGKYLPPSNSQWFNYGGDKLWLLPEGNDDEQHWPGNSDLIDDGPYTFRKIAEGPACEIELASPADPQTGIQFVRRIRIESDSSHIEFRAVMKNISGHTLDWSMQSVSQYNTSNGATPPRRNPEIRGITPVNPQSSYLNRYHVRFGPAENPAASVRDDGLFEVHYAHMAAELWIDSVAGWLAVVDGTSRFAMVEKFQYDGTRPYPGRASVIFWTNGPEIHLGKEGEATFPTNADSSPYYMEAELNSPMCHLRPGEECHFDTDWFPTRTESDIRGVTDSALVVKPLRATRLDGGKIRLAGTFGVLYGGRLVAHFYEQRGSGAELLPVADVRPDELVTLNSEFAPKAPAGRVSVHLIDSRGVDRGALGEVRIEGGEDH